MSTVPKEFEVVATTSWAEAFELKNGFTFKNIMVENLGTAVAQVAWGGNDNHDISVGARQTKVVEGDHLSGKVYVRHLGGFNPTLRIKIW